MGKDKWSKALYYGDDEGGDELQAATTKAATMVASCNGGESKVDDWR